MLRERVSNLVKGAVRLAVAYAQARFDPPRVDALVALQAPAPSTIASSPVVPVRVETFETYAARWLETRIAGGMASGIDYEASLRNHILGVLGPRPIAEITTPEIRSLVHELRTKDSLRHRKGEPKKLASMTVHGLFALVHNIFNSAVADEVIAKNPCVLRKGDLPKKKHAVVGFREKAVFTREEIEMLIDLGDQHRGQVPDYWRQLYRAAFFTGCRIGEICALTFEKLELNLAPLGKVTIAHSYSSKNRRVGSTKTGDVRTVPIHPAWAPHIRAWVEAGYKKYTGQDPQPDALVFPAKGRGKKRGQLIPRANTVCRHRFRDDLEVLGLRDRRVHDLRRTFVTLACNADGANTDILRRLTHARGGAVHDGYRETPWDVLCRELSKLKIGHAKKQPVPIDISEKEAVKKQTNKGQRAAQQSRRA